MAPVVDAPEPARVLVLHNIHHFFQGVCICYCRACTHHEGLALQCICTDCPADRCGLKIARVFGTHT